MDDLKKKLIKIGLIVFAVFILLIIVVVAVGSCTNRGGNNDNNPEQLEGDYELIVYKSDSGLCFQKSRECNKSPFRINTVTEDAKIIAIASNNLYLLYSDNGIKLYDVAKSKPSLMNLEDKYDYYEILLNGDVISGFVYGSNLIKEGYYTTLGYYDVHSNKQLYDGKYNNISIIDGGYLVGRNVSSNSSDLLNLKNEEVILEKNNTCAKFNVKDFNGRYLYIVNNSCDSIGNFEIISNEKNVIHSNLKDNSFSIDLSGNIYLFDGTPTIRVEGMNGTFMKNVTFDGTYKQLIINYVVFVNNNILYIKDLNRNSEPVVLMKWSNEYTYHYNSGYYPENYLFLANEKKAGIYVLVTKNSRSVAGTEVYFDIRTSTIKEMGVPDYREALKKN